MYDYDVFAKSVRVKNWYRSIDKKLFCMKLFPLIFKFKFDCGKFSGWGCGCAQLYFELLILIFSNRDLNLRARGRWSSRPPSPAEPRAENNDVHSAWTPTTQRVIKYLFNYFNKFSNSAFSKQFLKIIVFVFRKILGTLNVLTRNCSDGIGFIATIDCFTSFLTVTADFLRPKIASGVFISISMSKWLFSASNGFFERSILIIVMPSDVDKILSPVRPWYGEFSVAFPSL